MMGFGFPNISSCLEGVLSVFGHTLSLAVVNYLNTVCYAQSCSAVHQRLQA